MLADDIARLKEYAGFANTFFKCTELRLVPIFTDTSVLGYFFGYQIAKGLVGSTIGAHISVISKVLEWAVAEVSLGALSCHCLFTITHTTTHTHRQTHTFFVLQNIGDDQLKANTKAIVVWSKKTGRDAMKVRPPKAKDPTLLKTQGKWVDAPVMSALAERVLQTGAFRTECIRIFNIIYCKAPEKIFSSCLASSN